MSAKACQGILNRAERRGKELPPELKAALIEQSACKETGSTDPIPPDATAPDGAGGGSYTLNTIDRPAVLDDSVQGGAGSQGRRNRSGGRTGTDVIGSGERNESSPYDHDRSGGAKL